jgi:hypothetical protein
MALQATVLPFQASTEEERVLNYADAAAFRMPHGSSAALLQTLRTVDDRQPPRKLRLVGA